MDYKKIVKNKKIRVKILQLLSFIPDRMMIKIQYRIKTGKSVNLKEPRTFTEKLQYYKLYYRDPLMKQCVDKYDVRSYVKDCGLEDILNPCYGVYANPKEINFLELPNSFVLKDTLGSGGDSIIIVKDRSMFSEKNAIKQMKQWVSEPYFLKNPGREWVYDGRKHRIIIEKYIEENDNKNMLVDYKFFCFYGKVKFMYVITDRIMGKSASLAIYDENYKKINAYRLDENPLIREMSKPRKFDKMKKIAEKLSSPFPEVRIDLYETEERIIFGEITFFDGSGYMKYNPDSFDKYIGDIFEVKRNV